MKRKFLSALAIFLIVASMPTVSCGAQSGKSTIITLPGFGVTINGVKVDNTYSQYPFIVYKDVTYFPMTYSGCRFLGLENDWKGSEKGLAVDATGITAAYLPYKSAVKNSGSYKAAIPGFPVTVNGKAVDNARQQYPLLSFRSITYFPMTWDFAVKEFGWEYSFNAKSGLVINSDNIRLQQIAMTGSRAADPSGRPSDNVAVTDKYIYYEGTKGRIIQASLAEPARTKTVYQLPRWDYGQGEYVYSGLYADDGAAYLTYHQGGAVMGADYKIRLNDDGTTTQLQSSYTRIRSFGDKTFSYWTGGAPGPGNLAMKTGDGEYKPVGDPDFLYGWAWISNENSSGGGGSDDVYLMGDDLYILAFDMKAPQGATTGIYKVNVSTNETTRLSSRQALAFQLEGEFLYYVNEGKLYRISIRDGKEELVRQLVQLPDDVSSLAVLNGRAYWQDALNHNLYDENGENVNFGAALDDRKLMGDNSEYLVCTFQETELSKYRIMVFDKGGNAVFKTSDKAYCRNIDIRGNKIYFYNITTGTVCIGQLGQIGTAR